MSLKELLSVMDENDSVIIDDDNRPIGCKRIYTGTVKGFNKQSLEEATVKVIWGAGNDRIYVSVHVEGA